MSIRPTVPLPRTLNRRRWLMLALASAGAATLTRFDHRALAATTADAPRVIKIHARRFVFTPDKVSLAPHEKVIFELTSEDVVMGFAIPQLDVRVDVPPGPPVRVPAVAGPAGNVEFLCDIFCGSGHETMNGTLVVA